MISLVNPHDVLAFPRDWQEDYEPVDLDGSVELPPTVDEDLAANFYANLVAQIAPIIDCFYDAHGAPTPLGEETVLVRFSDHGEPAMSHGGLRQKAFNVYEESLRVPLIFSNPHLFPEARAV